MIDESSRPVLRLPARGTTIDLLRTAAEALLIFLLISALTGRFEVHQVSMEPNLHEGERIVVSKLERIWPTWLVGRAEAAHDPAGSPLALQRGQIVVLHRSPDHKGDLLIKRIVGLPGETVTVRDGTVLIDGDLLDEPYVNGLRTACQDRCLPTKIGPGMYYVLGDNRPNSLDSRNFGPIPADQIVGRVFLRYWPLDQIAFYR